MQELLYMHPTSDNIQNAIPVYILTETGTDYIEEGIHYMKDLIKKEYNDQNEFVMYTGPILNKPSFLKDRLEKDINANTSSYVVLSTEDDIIIISPEDNQNICDDINKYKNYSRKTTWSIIKDNC